MAPKKLFEYYLPPLVGAGGGDLVIRLLCNCCYVMSAEFLLRWTTEGYPDPVKSLIMEPSYRDAVEVRVVEHIKKEMFSHGHRSTTLIENLAYLSAIAVLMWNKINST